jgi:hypothetical protein
VTVRIVQLDDAGGATVDERTLDAFDLLDVAGQVGRILERVAAARALVAAGGTPSVVMGDHCGFCNARAACPGQSALARTVLGQMTAGSVEAMLAGASPEQVGVWWAKLEHVAPLVEEMQRGLKALVTSYGEVPLPDGRKVRSTGVPRRSIDARKALPVLQGLLGDGARGLAEMSLSVTAIEKASGARADEVFAALDSAGAIRQKVTPTVKAYGKARAAE